MTRQIEPETLTWHRLRKSQREQLAAATLAGDFATVPAQPFKDADLGDYGFPVSAAMETKLVDAYKNLVTTKLNANDQIGLLVQVNTLESFRRANLSSRQTRKQLLAHLQHKLAQEVKYDDLMLQVMSGTAKVADL